jgi:hypothetical protein
MDETVHAALRLATETLFDGLAQPRSGVGFVGPGFIPVERGAHPSCKPCRGAGNLAYWAESLYQSIHSSGFPLALYSHCMLFLGLRLWRFSSLRDVRRTVLFTTKSTKGTKRIRPAYRAVLIILKERNARNHPG